MYDKIILAADGSDESIAAAQEVNRLISHGLIKKVIVLNVVKPLIENVDIFEAEFMPTRSGEFAQIALSNGEVIVEELMDMVTGAVEKEKRVIFGDPSHIICEEALSENVDLIVMGSRGRNPVQGMLLGSVSARVLSFARCPVLIVKATQ